MMELEVLLLTKKEETQVEYSSKEERERFYLIHPTDIANIVLKQDYPESFDISNDNYTVILNQKLVAQCKIDISDEKRIVVRNLNLVPGLESEMAYNYIVNAIESIPIFSVREIEAIIIKKINNISTNSLVI